MAPSAPTSSLRRLLDERVSEILSEAERLCESSASERSAAASGRARTEIADQLNQAVRRLRNAADPEELRATLVDASGAFATALALFRIDGSAACGERVRGVDQSASDSFVSLNVPLSEAAALAGAVETKDPVVAVTTASEVSAAMLRFVGHRPEDRAFIFPVIVRGSVHALLYGWGAVESAALESLAQVAGAVWESIERPTASNLVSIGPAPRTEDAAPRENRPSWESLSFEERGLHLRAQRFARVRVAEIRLRHSGEVQNGRNSKSLYAVLQRQIDSARETMRSDFFAPCPSMVDYLHLELVRTLANDDAELLGEDYPGPIV